MEYYSNNDWRYYIQSRNELMHFGIPKRSGRYPWGSGEDPYHHGADSPRKKAREQRKLDRTAKKDAKRYADAKMYYGQGAGNRRKLLKGELSEKMKNEDYKRAFEKYVDQANYEKSARRAKAERHIRDTGSAARRSLRSMEAVMGVSMIGLAGSYYMNNREKVNNIIKNLGNIPLSYYEKGKAYAFTRRYGL